MDCDNDISRATHSLRGLSLGDSFGELFFRLPQDAITRRELPPGIWRYTDDTHMALSVVQILSTHERIDQDSLIRSFADAYRQEPWRGYAGGAQRLLSTFREEEDWRAKAQNLFPGGSYGNGGAMRSAPIGAYFHKDPERAAHEATLSAEVTHAHPEGHVGAAAVAVAASLFACQEHADGANLLRQIADLLSESETREGILRAMDIPPGCHQDAIALGTGQNVSAADTVPFCLWMAAHHGSDFEDAMWLTVAGLGDRDTTCAIVGGILSADGRSLPDVWLQNAEELAS